MVGFDKFRFEWFEKFVFYFTITILKNSVLIRIATCLSKIKIYISKENSLDSDDLYLSEDKILFQKSWGWSAIQDHKIEIILEALKKEFNPLRVFMFGSQVTDKATSDSDYDFVVVVKETAFSRIENMRKARAIIRQVAQVSADVFVYGETEFNEYKNELSSIPETALNLGQELGLG